MLAVGCVAFGPVTKEDITTGAVSEETAHPMAAGRKRGKAQHPYIPSRGALISPSRTDLASSL